MITLLDLSPELLYKVYDWLRLIEAADTSEARHWGGSPADSTCAPVSHALQPYTQAYRYHTVKLWDPTSLVLFAAAVARDPELGAAVRSADVSFQYDEGDVPVNWNTLVGMWGRLGQVQELELRTFQLELETLTAAVKGGLSFPVLRSMEITFIEHGWANPYLLDNWRPLLAAAPKLDKLCICLALPEMPLDSAPPLPAVPGPALDSPLSSLEVLGVGAGHERALAGLIRSFLRLNSLTIESENAAVQPQILGLLAAPELGTLSFSWVSYSDDDSTSPFATIDVRHLQALENFTFTSNMCAPSLEFLLPASVRTVSIGMFGEVPLAALIKLVTPGTRSFTPTLNHLELDLPFQAADIYEESTVEIDGVQTTKRIHNVSMEMKWTDEVSPEALRSLIDATAKQGVQLTGNCHETLRAHGG